MTSAPALVSEYMGTPSTTSILSSSFPLGLLRVFPSKGFTFGAEQAKSASAATVKNASFFIFII